MTTPLMRGPGFTPPARSSQALLRGIALPQLVAILTLVVSTAAMLMAVTVSVSSADRHPPVPVTSNIHSRLL
jgi:hypothetical protein